MKYFKLKLYIILFAVLIFNTAEGYAQFEDTGAGARAAGMGNAYVAEASGPETIYYNPAGLANSDTYQLSSSYSRLFWGLTDNSRLGKGYLGYMMPINEKISAGFAWQNFMLDSYYSEDTFYFSGSYRISDDIAAGLNLKILSKKYASTEYTRNSVDLNTGQSVAQTNPVFKDGYSKLAFSPDLGVLYNINYTHRVGLTIKNLTRPDMALSSNDSDRIPMEIKAGYRYIYGNMRLLTDMSYSDGDINLYTGAENWFISQSLGIRGGLGLGSRLYREATLGASYRFSNTFKLDYAFKYPLSGVISSYGTHKLGFVIKFGDLMKIGKMPQEKTRKEGWGLSIEDKARTDDIVKAGEKLFEEEKYIQARAKFKEALKISSEHPEAGQKLQETDNILSQIEERVDDTKKKYLRGVYNMNRGEYQSASVIFEELLVIDTMGSEELTDIKERAQEKYDELKDEEIVRAEKHISKAESYFKNENYRDSIEEYQSALEIIPQNEKASDGIEKARQKLIEKHYGAGINYYLDENYKEAREEFRKVLQIDSNHKQARDMLEILGEEE